MSSSVGSPTHDESGLGHIRFNDDDSFTVVDSLGSPLHDNMSDDDSLSSSSSSSISSSSGSSSSSVSSSDSGGDKSTDNDATPSPKPPQEVDKQSTSPSVAATSDAKEEHNSNSSANDNYHSDLKLLSTIIESKATRPSQVPWRSLTHKGEDCHERFEELCDDYVADDDDLDLPLWELASVIALQLNKAAGVVGTNEETVSVVDASARTIASSMDAGGKEGTASLPPVNKGKRKLSQEEKQPASMTGETTAATQKPCSFEGCFKQEQIGGLCFKHGKLADGHKLHLLNIEHRREVKKDALSPTLVESFPSELYYNPKINNESMELQINGRNVQFKVNYVTSRTSRKKPKAQLTSELFNYSAAPHITPLTHGHFCKVKFSDESDVYVLYATRDSACPILQDVYFKAYHNLAAGDLEQALDDLPSEAWEYDHHAGGRYVAFGIGSMDKRWHRKPFFLSNHQYTSEATVITQCLGGIFSAVAEAVLNYVPEAFRQNESLKCNNENFSYPPLTKQSAVSWFSTQIVIRRVGQGCTNKEWRKETNSISKKDLNVVALHADKGDVSNLQPLVYIPRGGENNKGGCVADSILLVAENEGGGKYVTIETNCEDTVCIVLLNSSKNLHGLIEGDGKDDVNAYCTRIIPFITMNIYHYLKKNPNDSPINDYEF